ncbi:MAG: hypothetical protein Q8Q33_10365 [Chlamydiota bacterium]|nr:hypothetical protein [Chlamydiota bacterium]
MTIKYGFLIFTLLTLTQAVWAEDQCIQFDWEGRQITYRYESKLLYSVEEDGVIIPKLEKIIRNIMFFEQEVHDTHLLEGADINIEGKIYGQFSALKVHAVRKYENGAAGAERKYIINEVVFDADHVRFLRLLEDRGEKTPTVFYDIYNIDFDKNAYVLKKIILKSFLDVSEGTGLLCEKFIEGIKVQYQDFGGNGLALSFTYQYFLLTKNAGEMILKEKKSFNRHFNQEGYIVSQTTQETSYTYSQQMGMNDAVFNVRYHPSGQIKSYNIASNMDQKNSSSGIHNVICFNIERDDAGLELHETIRTCTTTGAAVQYLSGKQRDYAYDSEKHPRFVAEKVFDIKVGTDGLNPSDRTVKQELYMWNMAYDKSGQIIRRRILKTLFKEVELLGRRVRLRLYNNLRDIYIFRDEDNGNMKGVRVDYLICNGENLCVKDRSVEAQVIEFSFRHDPLKIKLIVRDLNETSASIETEIVQDCEYILNEAISGELFTPQRSMNEDMQIVYVDKEGASLLIFFYSFGNLNDMLIYMPYALRFVRLA